MSADKRRHARVQGGWAAPPKQDRDVKSNKLRPAGPGWLGKTVDSPEKKKFVYEEPQEDTRGKPAVRVIDQPGVYDLSTTSKGVSRVRLFYDLIDPVECCWMFDTLFHELPWQQESNVYDGKPYVQPRMTTWFGDLPYRYSGITQARNSNWHPLLLSLRSRLEEITGIHFNSVLCNLYRNEKDSVAWHADDEPSLQDNPTIASLSFGDTRNFELRQNPPPDQQDPLDWTYCQHVRIPLTNGSLCIMEGCTQSDWQHRIPKEYHDRQPRINLTYRIIYPE